MPSAEPRDEREDTRSRARLRARLPAAHRRLAGHMRECQHPRSRRDRPRRSLHEVLGPRGGLLADDGDGVAEPLRLLRPRTVVAGWLSAKITTLSPALRSSPLETMLFASLGLRAMTISSGSREEPREETAGLFLDGAHILPVVERGIAIHVFRARIHARERERERDRDGRVHQARFVSSEPLAHRHPEAVHRPVRRRRVALATPPAAAQQD